MNFAIAEQTAVSSKRNSYHLAFSMQSSRQFQSTRALGSKGKGRTAVAMTAMGPAILHPIQQAENGVFRILP